MFACNRTSTFQRIPEYYINYINDLSNYVTHVHCTVNMYADDTVIYLALKQS